MEISFTINNRTYSINPRVLPYETTLNTFIRTHAKLTGTKFMCLEGGCGVCIVNITGFHPITHELQSFAVNSCLWLVYACHGYHVTTIEGIGNRLDGYHPIQNVLYQFNGTQCGFCSPGMIMNMYSLLEANKGTVTMQTVENSFGGNICRCTGYRPILDAFKSLASDTVDIEDIEAAAVCCSRKKSNLGQYRHVSAAKLSYSSKEMSSTFLRFISPSDDKMWYKIASLQELLSILGRLKENEEYMLVSGNTAHGVYRRSHTIKYFIDINTVVDLHRVTARRSQLHIGGNVSLTELLNTLAKASKEKTGYEYLKYVVKHIDLIATLPVRNAGSIAGNLNIKHMHNEFPSDIFLLLESIGATLNIISTDGTTVSKSPAEYLALNMNRKVIVDIELPKLDAKKFIFRSYKIMIRAQNAHAIINAGFLIEFTGVGNSKKIISCRICYGGINPKFIHATTTENMLVGINFADLYTNETLQKIVKSLNEELQPDWILPDSSPEYRKNLAISIFYKFFLNTAPVEKVRKDFALGGLSLKRQLSSGVQIYSTKESLWPITQPVLKYEGLIQCSGEAQYTNDIFSGGHIEDELFAAFVPATEIHAKIINIDASKALKIEGVREFYSAKDIPGINSFTPPSFGKEGILEDEEIFVGIDSKILFNGQPCGIIVAESMAIANNAATKVKITYKKLKGEVKLLNDSLSLAEDNEQQSIANDLNYVNESCEHCDEVDLESSKLVKGNFKIGQQYHYSMETQTVFCTPSEDGGLDVYAASQWIDLIQSAVSKCLSLPENKINMIVRRLGGAFGSKITRTSQIACACALACHLLRQPIRFVMTIESNMAVCGKRFACANEYEVRIIKNTGKIRKLTNRFVQDYGCSQNDNFQPYVISAIRNGYESSAGWKNIGEKMLSNIASATWCRAPGTLEAIAMIENIMEHIAFDTQIDPAQVRLANLSNGSVLKALLSNFLDDIDYSTRKNEIDVFNSENRWRKRGIGITTMKFPIEYLGVFPSLVVIYHGDGTVVVSHGGIECGQGINTKVAQVAAFSLGIPLSFIVVKATNNVIGANSVMTGGSVTSESVCLATKRSCEMLLQRIKPIREGLPSSATWQEIVQVAHQKFIDLSAKYMFKPSLAKTYDVFGCASAEIELDVLTGNMQILRVDIVEDTGRSISPLVDVGQIEGAFTMGIGYWLNEKLIYDPNSGELLTNRTWHYKTPGAKDIPIDFRIKFVQTNATDNVGILRSKTTGEPAICMSIVVLFALRHSLNSARLDSDAVNNNWFRMGSAFTPEECFLAARTNLDDFRLN